jgi:hypothetical protein
MKTRRTKFLLLLRAYSLPQDLFTKPLSGHERGDTQAHRQQGNLVRLLLFYQNRGSRIITAGTTFLLCCLQNDAVRIEIIYSRVAG